jgi:hypothetical protein
MKKQPSGCFFIGAQNDDAVRPGATASAQNCMINMR